MKVQIPKVKCPTCDGRGEIEIPKHLADTLDIVRRLGTATSFDVHKDKAFQDHVVPTAVSNRLDDLFRLNLLTRVRNGRAWLYSVAK